MAGSLTVIGGAGSDSTLSGLVTIPSDQSVAGSFFTGLQSILTADSQLVTSGGAYLNNVNIVGNTTSTFGDSSLPGILEITNTNNTGAISPGNAPSGYSTTVGAGYNTLIVQAPGDETITGNGSSGFLAIFGAESAVTFNASGSGTVVASANNFLTLSSTVTGSAVGWSVVGSQIGGDTINANGSNAFISLSGSSNQVGLGGSTATVVSSGSNDLIASFSGNNSISLSGSNANVLVEGGSDTVYATMGASGNTAFFAASGGLLDFINNSNSAMSVRGSVTQQTSGSVTVQGGVGGGYYQGGQTGNNSLVGGTGNVTLIGAGDNNFLSAAAGDNDKLFAGDGGGSAVLIAGVSTTGAQLSGNTGSDTITTYGQGSQNIFAGYNGNEVITGSTASGATNNYYFNNETGTNDQTGFDIITNFRYGTDNVLIDAFNLPGDKATITNLATVPGVGGGGASTLLSLSDGTTIKLVGTTFTSAQSATIMGSSGF